MKIRILALTIAILLLAITPHSLAQRKGASRTETSAGLVITTFETRNGAIRVHLPDDMAAGDTISGTVTAEPSARNEKEKQRNSDELKGYVIEFGNQKSPVSGGILHRVSLTQGATAPLLILLDGKGRQIATAPIPVAAAPATTGPSTFGVRAIGQTGKPIQVQGPFDGNSGNTSARVGGIEAKVLAESPRKMIFESPRSVVGPTTIEVVENGATATGQFRNLKIDLTAPKTSLLKGESTELRVQVSGLEGLTQPVPMQVQNHSPSTVNLSGGNTQNIIIQPGQVQSGGTFVQTGGVTGIQSGGFSITGTIPSGSYASPNPSTTPPPPTSTPPATQGPSPSPPQTGTVPAGPSPTPTSGPDLIDIEMVQLLSGPVNVPAGPMPERVPMPTPTSEPCACDVVTLPVSAGNYGVNKVLVAKEGNDVNAAAEIAGARIMVTLKFVDHEIKCTGRPGPEKCSAMVDWKLEANFTFKANGKDGKPAAWDGKKSTGEQSGAMKYEEFLSKEKPTQIILEGTCDPTAAARKRPSYTVSQLLIVKYPDELVAAIKEAEKEKPKPKVDVGEITATITWTVKAKDCKSPYGSFLEGKKEIGSFLTRQFVLKGKGWTY